MIQTPPVYKANLGESPARGSPALESLRNNKETLEQGKQLFKEAAAHRLNALKDLSQAILTIKHTTRLMLQLSPVAHLAGLEDDVQKLESDAYTFTLLISSIEGKLIYFFSLNIRSPSAHFHSPELLTPFIASSLITCLLLHFLTDLVSIASGILPPIASH